MKTLLLLHWDWMCIWINSSCSISFWLWILLFSSLCLLLLIWISYVSWVLFEYRSRAVSFVFVCSGVQWVWLLPACLHLHRLVGHNGFKWAGKTRCAGISLYCCSTYRCNVGHSLALLLTTPQCFFVDNKFQNFVSNIVVFCMLENDSSKALVM